MIPDFRKRILKRAFKEEKELNVFFFDIEFETARKCDVINDTNLHQLLKHKKDKRNNE